jgi:chemotaxis protein histidine kinase CheA
VPPVEVNAPTPARPDGPTGPATPAETPAPIGEVLVQAGQTTPEAVQIARMEQGLGDARPIGAILVEHGSTTPAAVEGALETQDARRSVVDSSVRVDVELLDTLMRMVGELVLARNQLVSHMEENDNKGHVADALGAAAQPGHQRAAGAGHEDPHAAGGLGLEQAARASSATSPASAAARCGWRWRAATPSSTAACWRRSRTR